MQLAPSGLGVTVPRKRVGRVAEADSGPVCLLSSAHIRASKREEWHMAHV